MKRNKIVDIKTINKKFANYQEFYEYYKEQIEIYKGLLGYGKTRK